MDVPGVDDPTIAEGDVPAPEAAAPEVDSYDAGGTVFDREYVERLRGESAARHARVKELEERFSPWKDALDGWDEEQAEAVRDLLAAAKAGDTEAIATILGLGDDTAGAPAAPTAPVAEAGYLTASDLERILADREQKAQVDAQVKAIEGEAKSLGYEQGSNDYALLFKIAHEQTSGDLNLAHSKVLEWKQSLVDQFVAQKANGANPPPSGSAPSGEREITNFEQAKAAAMARFGASQVS